MAVNAERALEEMSLLRDRLSLPVYALYMDGFQDRAGRDGMAVIRPQQPGPAKNGGAERTSGSAFTTTERDRLSMADPYYVAAEMMPLIAQTAAELSGVARFTRELWPREFGFLYFEQTLPHPELWGRQSRTRAISWGRHFGHGAGPGGPGTLLIYYTDLDDPEGDEITEQLLAETAQQGRGGMDRLRSLGRLHVQHMDWIADEQRVGPATVTTTQPSTSPHDDLTRAAEYENPARPILALLTLLGQTVVDAETHRSPTPKRWRRQKLPPAVTVIRLRRTADGTEHVGPPGNVQWRHQWIVGHFWRWQPMGQRVFPDAAEHRHYSPRQTSRTTYTVESHENGRHVLYCNVPRCGARVEAIHIREYVKGPAGMPLRVPGKIYSLEK